MILMVISGCAGEPITQSMNLVINNASIVDGSGSAPFRDRVRAGQPVQDLERFLVVTNSQRPRDDTQDRFR